ncbi:MAG: hypothetical protein KAJ51_01830 [Thermoplasmata archaeon]|nr:hypothetical protein [Thermoplasmata archaeon]
MIRRQMTPALEKLVVIDLTNFLIAITLSEHAVKTTIKKLKQDIFGWDRKGGV